jgi:hypothetical protein
MVENNVMAFQTTKEDVEYDQAFFPIDEQEMGTFV